MISVAAELAEMHPQTLRMYEQRGLIAPKRSPKNTRLYSQRDVERLRRIQQMTAEGLNLAGVETVLALEAQVQKLRAEGERLRKRIAELEEREERRDGLMQADQVHGEIAGSGGGGAGAGAQPAATRRSPRPTCCWRCSTRPKGWRSRSCRRSAPTRRRSRAQANEAVAALPTLGDGAEPQMSSNLARVLRGAEQEMAKFGDSYITVGHLLLALAEDGSGVSDLLPDRDELERAVQGRAGPGEGHLPERRGQRPGAGEIRPRPDRRGREREARPGDRPRRGDPPRDPGPLPPDQEQPGADRRPRRRQDGDRRGAGAADRQGRRAREPARPARDRARHRLAAGRLQIPRRVRGAAESGARTRCSRPRARSSSSSTSSTRSSAPAPPKARSTPPTC